LGVQILIENGKAKQKGMGNSVHTIFVNLGQGRMALLSFYLFGSRFMYLAKGQKNEISELILMWQCGQKCYFCFDFFDKLFLLLNAYH
jgi:hypothetical protein